MKTIGFVDYYLSEWHANNYPGWIKEICEEKGIDVCLKYAWAEENASPLDGKTTEQWCEDFGCEKCETLSELCEKCDYVLVLSPSNPEKHLQYAKEVLKYKKNTYIDKTFAPDYDEAKEIFEIAEKYGTKFFSSSALRYADELSELENVKNIVTTGGGGNLPEYIIHQIEMVEKLLKEKAVSVRVENQGRQSICNVVFENDKKATMIYAPALPFAVCAENDKGESLYKVVSSDFFKNLLADILNFYETGERSFDPSETLEIMKIRTGVIKAFENPGECVKL